MSVGASQLAEVHKRLDLMATALAALEARVVAGEKAVSDLVADHRAMERRSDRLGAAVAAAQERFDLVDPALRRVISVQEGMAAAIQAAGIKPVEEPAEPQAPSDVAVVPPGPRPVPDPPEPEAS